MVSMRASSEWIPREATEPCHTHVRQRRVHCTIFRVHHHHPARRPESRRRRHAFHAFGIRRKTRIPPRGRGIYNDDIHFRPVHRRSSSTGPPPSAIASCLVRRRAPPGPPARPSGARVRHTRGGAARRGREACPPNHQDLPQRTEEWHLPSARGDRQRQQSSPGPRSPPTRYARDEAARVVPRPEVRKGMSLRSARRAACPCR